MQALNKAGCVCHRINQLGQMRSCYVLTYSINEVCWRGTGGGGGTFWLIKEPLTFNVPAA